MIREEVILLVLVFFGFTNTNAQNNYKEIDKSSAIFIYSYQFYDVQKDPESLKRQDMVLEVGKTCSKFYSTSKQYLDSLYMLYANEPIEVAASKVFPLISSNTTPIFASFYVYKGYPKPSNVIFIGSDMGASNFYKVLEEPDFSWIIDSKAKAKVLGYSCTKATCSFAGRDYEAWFTTEISINDGPYKFRGLPGLIVKIEDSDKEHIFELQEVKSIKNNPIYFADNEYINTNAKGYVKALEASKAAFIATLNDFVKSDEARRIRAISRVQKRNNFIERY